jgi:hypothetical protein
MELIQTKRSAAGLCGHRWGLQQEHHDMELIQTKRSAAGLCGHHWGLQ